jgi:hypothetical protein
VIDEVQLKIHWAEVQLCLVYAVIAVIFVVFSLFVGSGSIVGIATCYRLDGPGIEFQWGKIFCTHSDRP